jgi:hypothetical protein
MSMLFSRKAIISVRILAMSIAWVVISTPLISAQDLSRYREFQLGMSLVTVARQAGISAEPRVLYQRPELIQELMWQPPRVSGSVPQGDSVRKVLFSFYNDQLFRMVITYERERTEGLTAEDMVEAISTKYGLSTLPSSEIMPSSSRVSNGSDKILAHWEDSHYALNLSSSYLSTFGLAVLSKRLDALARAATVEAIRLDEQDAPQRETARQQKQTDENRLKQETARRMNKAIFRP